LCWLPLNAPMLETHDLTIRFGGHVAVNAVTCALRRAR
jgi:ABC-type branched-subunit amino acid transport system ATPase component